jgi:hypothetical protein
MRIPKLLFVAISLIVVSPSLLAQYITVPVNDQIKFEDNGEIRSLDHAHRIMFRRSENILEFREFGRILFSPGATSGTETARMVLLDNGNVGIGTSSPSRPFYVSTTSPDMAMFKNTSTGNASIAVANNTGQMSLGIGATTPHPYIWSTTGNFFIGNDGDPTLFVSGMGNGNVGIGTADTKGYKFAVNGNAVFNKVVVKPTNNWPDYVFQPTYRLRPLSEVEEYIKQYHHLPEVPTAEEVEKNGLDVGDNQATLLKKIEELTMYVIEQQKEIKALKKDMEQLKTAGK